MCSSPTGGARRLARVPSRAPGWGCRSCATSCTCTVAGPGWKVSRALAAPSGSPCRCVPPNRIRPACHRCPGSLRWLARGVPKLGGETILIVDDDKQVRELIAICLQEEGYRTVIAIDGAEAMTAVSQQLPDLVLADVNMPNMNGLELARRLRSDPLTAGIPIMMLSALVQSKHVLAGYSNGADEYATKPIELAVLAAKVQSLLSRRLGSPADTATPTRKDDRLRARERRRPHDDAYRVITDRLTDALTSQSDHGPDSGDAV